MGYRTPTTATFASLPFQTMGLVTTANRLSLPVSISHPVREPGDGRLHRTDMLRSLFILNAVVRDQIGSNTLCLRPSRLDFQYSF